MNKTINRGPGRPKYTPVIPKGRFTMATLCEANGVSLKTGKGKICSRLTLIKFIARDAKRNGQSLIMRLKDMVTEPNSKDGMGRKPFVYQSRTKSPAVKTTRKPATKSTAPKNTAEYEAAKAAILAPVAVITPPVAVEPPAETAPVVAEATHEAVPA